MLSACACACVSRLIVQGKLTVFVFFKQRLPVALWEKALRVDVPGHSWNPRQKPWPRHSTWTQITFQSHSRGNARDWTDSFGWRATQHRKQDLGALCIPCTCQRAPLWECRGWDKECLQINCFYLHRVPDGWGSPHWTAQRKMRQSQTVFKHDFLILFCGFPF